MTSDSSPLNKEDTPLPEALTLSRPKLDQRDQGTNTGQETTDDSTSPIDEESTLLTLKATRELIICNKLYQIGSYEDALAGYETLIRQLGDEKLLANLGYTLQALDRHEEAILAFQKYLKVFIARNHAWKALCFSYYHLKDYENMTRCAREAIRWDIRLNTPDDYSWQQMATAHFLMEDYSTALKAARKASTINERNPFSLYYEACIISALVEGATLDQEGLLEEEPSYEQALALLQKALQFSPKLEAELRDEGYLTEVFKLFDTSDKPNIPMPEAVNVAPPAEIPTLIKAQNLESVKEKDSDLNQEDND